MMRRDQMMTADVPKRRLTAGTLLLGLIASVCCGGSLVFASVGLGAFYAALGLSRYPGQVLVVGALSIIGLNYLVYRRAATSAGNWRSDSLRSSMFVSATIGLAAMAASFVLLEWLNHAVANAHAFLTRPEYGHALIPGVPNLRLLYALGSLSALALLWALPFPHAVGTSAPPRRPGDLLGRACIFAGTAAVLVVLTAATISGADLSGVQHRVGGSNGVQGSTEPGTQHTPVQHHHP